MSEESLCPTCGWIYHSMKRSDVKVLNENLLAISDLDESIDESTQELLTYSVHQVSMRSLLIISLIHNS